MSSGKDSARWPVRTARLTIRPATEDDLDATWQFRRLPDVGEWLTRLPTEREAYTEHPLRICFEDLGVRRVVAHFLADNLASRKLMERLGMRLEDHAVQESLHRSERWVDSMRYAVLEEEWRARAH